MSVAKVFERYMKLQKGASKAELKALDEMPAATVSRARSLANIRRKIYYNAYGRSTKPTSKLAKRLATVRSKAYLKKVKSPKKTSVKSAIANRAPVNSLSNMFTKFKM